MAQITIIPCDGFVKVDGIIRPAKLDLSSCGIPANVHALQWFGYKGWIEFNDDGDPFTSRQPNEEITELPIWANNSVAVHENWTPPQQPEQVA